jgi:colicin import membrane protein
MTARPHLEFAPPPAPGLLRAMVLAILAHALLLVALSLGVQWKSDPVVQAFEAELWASVPVEAAPPAPEPEPPKPVPPEIKPEPKPLPKPVPPSPTAAELKAQADIALAKEKDKQLKEKKLEQEKLELEKKKKLAELEKKKQAELDKQKQAKLEQEKKDKEKLAADKEKEKDKRLQEQREAKVAEELRKAAIKRATGLAGAGGNGAPNSTSTAPEARSLSNSYAGRIRSYIKRFLTYTETINGNPTTEIEVRLASDGSILSRRITKPSGTKSWDDAALNAIDKAEKLPLDENGRAPSPMTIVWSAQEVTR